MAYGALTGRPRPSARHTETLLVVARLWCHSKTYELLTSISIQL